MTRLSERQINRLANDVRAKILNNKSLIAEAESGIIIKVYLKGDGVDIKLTVTI